MAITLLYLPCMNVMRGFGVIWNSIINPEPLIEVIKKRCIVEQCESITFNTSEELNEYIMELYMVEKKNKDKIIHKAELLRELSNKRITILILNFDSRDMYFHSGKGRMVYSQMDELKQEIRNMGKQILGESYWFDNVFHISENASEFNAALSASCKKLSLDCLDRFKCWTYLNSNRYMYKYITKDPQVIYVSPQFLLFHNLRNAEDFNQGNILIKYHVIKCFYEGNCVEAWNLYNEMMHARVKTCQFVDNSYFDHQEKFIELIHSFEEKGFLGEYPITVNENLDMIDGTHRLACALFFGIKQIPVIINGYSVYGVAEFRMEWFRNMGLERHIQVINEELNNLYHSI